MKKLTKFLFLLAISLNTFSQSLTERITGILYQIGKNIPADQLFLHLDRNLYHAGDTIRFQAYVRDSRTGIIATESSALYTLLLNSNHVTIDSARFRIISSTVPGWLKVPDNIVTGDYSILAFTSMDMNYSPEYTYSAPIRINTIKPVVDDTKQTSNNENISSYQLPLEQQIIDLRFLPEGGTFIYGIHQRLAFNAVTSAGRNPVVSGQIINQKGEKITEFRSTPYGPGVLEFTPLSGDSYFATLSGEEFNGFKWPLPSPAKSGIAMRVNNAGDGLTDIILRGKEIAGKSYFLTVTMNNILLFSEDVRIDTLFRERIQSDKLPPGTAFITLYDSELNPVAERLIFLNDYKKMNVKIKVSSPFSFHGDETELTISTSDDSGNSISSNVSIAVIDSASGYDKGIPLPEIESACLFEKGFYNNLPLRLKIKGLNNINNQSIDLLLMTYGWRKFTPGEIDLSIPDKELVNYDFLKINNPGPEKKGRSDIKLISDASLDVISLALNNKREAVLFYDSLDAGVRQIMILPDNNPAANINPVRISFPDNKDFADKAKLSAAYPDYLSPDLPAAAKRQADLNRNGYVMIEPVTIKAPVQPVIVNKYIDKHAKMYQSTGATTWYRKDFGPAFSLEDILYRYNPYKLVTFSWALGVQDHQIFLRNTTPTINGGHTEKIGNQDVFVVDEKTYPALFVVDNNPIGTSYETIASMPSTQIASVTFLRGVQGVPMYGVKANGGVVFITTKTGSGFTDDELDHMDQARRNDDLLREVRLFRTETEYYIPAKEEVAIMPELQFRPTILWQDNVNIDESGTITIRYPNNMVKGNVMVIVNGISLTNLIGSARYSYEVK